MANPDEDFELDDDIVVEVGDDFAEPRLEVSDDIEIALSDSMAAEAVTVDPALDSGNVSTLPRSSGDFEQVVPQPPPPPPEATPAPPPETAAAPASPPEDPLALGRTEDPATSEAGPEEPIALAAEEEPIALAAEEEPIALAAEEEPTELAAEEGAKTTEDAGDLDFDELAAAIFDELESKSAAASPQEPAVERQATQSSDDPIALPAVQSGSHRSVSAQSDAATSNESSDAEAIEELDSMLESYFGSPPQGDRSDGRSAGLHVAEHQLPDNHLAGTARVAPTGPLPQAVDSTGDLSEPIAHNLLKNYFHDSELPDEPEISRTNIPRSASSDPPAAPPRTTDTAIEGVPNPHDILSQHFADSPPRAEPGRPSGPRGKRPMAGLTSAHQPPPDPKALSVRVDTPDFDSLLPDDRSTSRSISTSRSDSDATPSLDEVSPTTPASGGGREALLQGYLSTNDAPKAPKPRPAPKAERRSPPKRASASKPKGSTDDLLAAYLSDSPSSSPKPSRPRSAESPRPEPKRRRPKLGAVVERTSGVSADGEARRVRAAAKLRRMAAAMDTERKPVTLAPEPEPQPSNPPAATNVPDTPLTPDEPSADPTSMPGAEPAPSSSGPSFDFDFGLDGEESRPKTATGRATTGAPESVGAITPTPEEAAPSEPEQRTDAGLAALIDYARPSGAGSPPRDDSASRRALSLTGETGNDALTPLPPGVAAAAAGGRTMFGSPAALGLDDLADTSPQAKPTPESSAADTSEISEKRSDALLAAYGREPHDDSSAGHSTSPSLPRPNLADDADATPVPGQRPAPLDSTDTTEVDDQHATEVLRDFLRAQPDPEPEPAPAAPAQAEDGADATVKMGAASAEALLRAYAQPGPAELEETPAAQPRDSESDATREVGSKRASDLLSRYGKPDE